MNTEEALLMAREWTVCDMTYKEALKYCKECVCFAVEDLDGKDAAELEKTVIRAIRKQIPKKPINNNRAFFCPVCEKNVGLTLESNGTKISHFEHYCEECGQAIDWSEEK